MGNPVVATISRTWTLINALRAQLETITTANGYLTDAGANVWTTDHQRPESAALGIMIYSESITGAGLNSERPGKAVREFTMLLEVAIGTEQDDAQQLIHSVIEDIESCLQKWSATQFSKPSPAMCSPMVVGNITILDRPEGVAIIAAQMTVLARYFR